ncbi:MAG: Ig-like domain-containing protein, partial [Phycisphaerae bacterium]
VSTQGPGLSVTYDTTAPSAPGALDLQDASDTGSLATDNVTNDNTPTFTVPGTAIPYYRVYRFGTLLSPGYETASTFTAPTTADGTYQFWAVAVDAAGNESAPGTVLSVTVDTVAPAAPTAPDLRATSDTGSSATDNLTNAMYPAFDLAHAGAGSLRFTLDGVAGHRVSTTGAGTYTLTAGPVAFAAENRATNGVQATRIWTADFNRDGRPDLVSGGYTSSLNVFLGNGTGGFSSNFTIALYAAASGFRVADLNHDSNPDLVVANGTNGTISIILGRGDGTFMPQTLLPVGETAGDVVVADFDGDTHPDVVTTTAADSLRFYRGVGDGTFAPAVATSFVRAGLLRAVDTDADGRPELMIASTALPELSTLKLRADGTVESGTTNTLASPATGFEVADFNGDGRPDFVTVGSNGSTLLTRQADGTMLRQIATIAGGLSSVTVADFNLDGAPDVAWGSSAASARTITVRLNRGDGTFHPDLSITTAYPTSGLTGADLTGDGRPDLALVTTSSSALGLLASAPAYPLGDGLHTLTSQLSDLAGNASPESAPLTFTIDRVAPTTNVPAVVTADQDPRLDGTVDDPSATVLVAWYPSLTYPTTVNPNGTWTLPDNTFQVPISFGVHEVTTISTDLAGNSRTQRFAGALTIALTTPVMVTEPAFTAGTANTVSWAAMPGVDAYFVQADTDPTFASPDASSGWITGTSHQFTGLTGGARYYYRVQALKTVEAGYEAVQESRQTYLAGTSGVGVTATWAPGQVVLAHTPTSNVSDDFEGGTYAGWAAGSGAYTRQVTTATAASGAYSLYLGGGAQGYFDGLTRGLPNSVPNLIKFRVRAGTTDAQQGYFIPTWNNGGYHPFYFVLEDDGTMAFVADGIAYRSPYVANQWYEVAINIDWTSRTMAFAVDGVVEHGSVPFPGATGAMTGLNIFNFSANSAVWFDAIEFFNKGTYSPSGTLTSVAITPPAATFRHWGAVTYTKVTPAGTALTVDILDAAGNVLATNVASGTNLRLLGITAPALRLRANLSTTSPSTVTPALQGWSLEYALAEGEQLSAWSAAVSSTQDANGPTVSLDNNQFITTPSPGFSGRIDDPAATVVVSIAGNTFAATNRGDGTWVLPAGTIPALTDGRYGVAVTATDPAGNRAAAGDTSWVVLTAPALVSWRVNGGAAQRSSVSSITLTFTTPVTPTDLAAIVLRRRSDGAPIDIEVTNPSNDEMNYLVTILPGPPFPRPQLVDGIYDLTLRHASIKDALNRAMAGPDTVLTFHRLAGDADGNGEVGLNDLVILSNNYGSTGGLPWSPGDFDGNGEVGLNDLVILSNMYGTKLALTDDPAPAAFAGGASVGPLADVSEPTSSDPLPHDEPIAPAVESPSAEQQQGTNTAMVAVTPLPATVPVTTETEEPLPAAQAPAVFEPTPAADPERTAAPMPAPARPFASTPARAVQSPVWTATPVAPKAATPVRPAAISAEFALTPPVPAKSGARSTPGRAAVPSARAAVASPFAAPRPPTSAKPRVTPAPTKGATVVASASTVAPLADAVPRIVGATAFHVRKRVPAVWEA